MIKETPISPRIQIILDTPYIFAKKHEKFMKEFIYKQETKYRVTPYEDELLRMKFDQEPQGSIYKVIGVNHTATNVKLS
jgi:hypothetical protein